MAFGFEELAFDAGSFVDDQGRIPVAFEGVREAAILLVRVPCHLVVAAFVARHFLPCVSSFHHA
jgi:hypothetical protein